MDSKRLELSVLFKSGVVLDLGEGTVNSLTESTISEALSSGKGYLSWNGSVFRVENVECATFKEVESQ